MSGFCKFIIFLVLMLDTVANVIRVSPHEGKDIVGCQAFSSSPCATLDYALESAHQYKKVSIELAQGSYTLSANDSVVTFTGMTEFTLVGIESIVSITCVSMTGFSFYNSSNIHFQNLSISGCGLLHNSSSSNSATTTEERTSFVEFLVGIYFLLCDNIFLSHVTMSNSPGTGVVFYSVGGNNVIMSSKFIHNGAVNQSDLYEGGGGGIAIEFVHCIPGDTKCTHNTGSSIPKSNYQNASFDITNCVFTNNTSSGSVSNDTDAFILPHSNHNVALGRGGGIGVVFKGKAKRIQISIRGCEFYENTATWGGGALFQFQDATEENSILVSKTKFVDNRCDYDSCTYRGTGGGGVRILFAGFSNLVKKNKLRITESEFIRNEAYFGGGISMTTFPEDVQTNEVMFDGVFWSGSKARLGSAVDLSVWDPTSTGTFLQPSFKNCTFDSNTVQYTDKLGTASGSGTIYADSIPIKFLNEVVFRNNQGSCIYSVEAAVEFDQNAKALFENNVGHNGGALSLHSNSYILLFNGSQLDFFNNKAYLHGGAIYWENVGNRYLISSRNCFIRYNDSLLDPTKWPVSLTFADNVAGVTGHDIFSTSLLGCLWGGSLYGGLIEDLSGYYKVFNWSSTIWRYKNASNSSIATAPSHFIKDDEGNCGSPYHLDAIPGKLTTLPIQMTDDRMFPYPQDSLVFTSVINDTNNTVQYLAFGEISFTGKEGEVKEYNISTLQPKVISSRVFLELASCPYGFKFDSDSEICTGAGFPFMQIHTNYTASIQRGFWIGTIENNTRTVVSLCYFCPLNKDLPPHNYILLPANEKLNDFFCGKLKRTGSLCHSCVEGYAPAVSSEEYWCVKCSAKDAKVSWIIFLLIKFLPISIILLIVVIFNISVTSGPANSFVLFAQVISTTFGVDAGRILQFSSITPSADALRKVYISLYGLWNLNFFEPFNVFNYCLGPNITALNLLALRYLTASYPLIVLAIVAFIISQYYKSNSIVVCLLRPAHRLLARFFQFFDLNRSIMDAFATFLVLSYAKFAVTSAYLLYPNPLIGANNEKVDFVSFIDSSMYYYSLAYSPYLFVSISVTIIVCLMMPSILFLYSIKPFYRFLERFHLSILLPGEKAQHFLNSFHHCYKDGSDGAHDRRYFASLYFFFRFILIYSYSIAISWAIQFIIQQVLCTLAIIVISVFQPYKNYVFNIIDSMMFGLLALVNVFTIYQRYLEVADIPLSSTCFYLQMILIFLPMMYIIFVVFYYQFYKVCLKKCKRHRREELTNSIDDFSFGEFMEGVGAEGRFHNVNYYRPIQPDELNCDVGDVQGASEVSQQQESSRSSFHLSHVLSGAKTPLLNQKLGSDSESTANEASFYHSTKTEQ